jgi:hypothetical protein
MTLSGSTTFNGLFVANSNLLFDAATSIISGGDWTLQLYYTTSEYTNDVKLFYVSDDSIGVNISPIDRQLHLYFNSNDIITDVPLGIFVDDFFVCYTFVKSGNGFFAFRNGDLIYSDLSIFMNIIYSNSVDYLCISPTQPNYINQTNYINFWNIALSNSFVSNYYQFIYPNDSPGLLFNIRGDVDYTSNNNIVERDLINSSIITVDICANTGNGGN